MGSHISFSGEVVVIGATGMDDISRPLHSMQAGASNPVHWQRFAGGVATNVARGISQLLKAHLVTAVGRDSEGQALVATLRDAGISVAPFQAPNGSTGNYTAVLDEKGELFVGLSEHLQCLWRPDEDYRKYRRFVRDRQDPVSPGGQVLFTGARESPAWSPWATSSGLLAT